MMKILNSLLLLIFCLVFIDAKTISIVGKVINEKNDLPVEFAGVFFANTTFGSYTNEKGEFVLTATQKASYDLIVSHVNFQTFVQTITIDQDSLFWLIKLIEKPTIIDPVVVKSNDPYRAENLNVFKYGLLGISKNAENCIVLNPAVLHFDWTARSEAIKYREMNTKADSNLIFYNKILGYSIKYNLEYFSVIYTSTSKKTTFYGYPLFEDNISDSKNQKRIEKNRIASYEGSKLHFFRSLYSKRLAEEGFEVYKVEEYPEVINENEDYGLLEDPFFIGKSNFKLGQTKQYLNLYDYLQTDTIAGFAVLSYDKPFEIRYVNKGEEFKYIKNTYFHRGIKRRLGSQITILRLKKGQLKFFQNGLYENPNNLLNIGYWSYKKLANSLPYNYQPIKKK